MIKLNRKIRLQHDLIYKQNSYTWIIQRRHGKVLQECFLDMNYRLIFFPFYLITLT